jgi:hypothetical protein
MLSLVVSTIVFFVASYFLKRHFDGMGLPKGMTRSLMVFCLALLVAYGAAVAVDWLSLHV